MRWQRCVRAVLNDPPEPHGAPMKRLQVATSRGIFEGDCDLCNIAAPLSQKPKLSHTKTHGYLSIYTVVSHNSGGDTIAQRYARVGTAKPKRRFQVL